MNVVRYFILTVVKVKKCSKRCHRYYIKSTEVKQRSERSQIFYFRSNEKNSVMSEVRGLGVVRKEKQRSGSSQIFHFNSSEVKSAVSVVRGFILTVVK